MWERDNGKLIHLCTNLGHYFIEGINIDNLNLPYYSKWQELLFENKICNNPGTAQAVYTVRYHVSFCHLQTENIFTKTCFHYTTYLQQTTLQTSRQIKENFFK